MEIFNANPKISATAKASNKKISAIEDISWLKSDDTLESTEESLEPIDSEEVFDLIRSITDPEHPLTLEQLSVVSQEQISINGNKLLVEFTPTVPHCGMATLIGLTIRVRLLRSLPNRFKIDIQVKQGSHNSEHAVNKQLNDKERVAAALENVNILGLVEQCLATAHQRGSPPA